jgi:hypothetical protein
MLARAVLWVRSLRDSACASCATATRVLLTEAKAGEKAAAEQQEQQIRRAIATRRGAAAAAEQPASAQESKHHLSVLKAAAETGSPFARLVAAAFETSPPAAVSGFSGQALNALCGLLSCKCGSFDADRMLNWGNEGPLQALFSVMDNYVHALVCFRDAVRSENDALDLECRQQLLQPRFVCNQELYARLCMLDMATLEKLLTGKQQQLVKRFRVGNQSKRPLGSQGIDAHHEEEQRLLIGCTGSGDSAEAWDAGLVRLENCREGRSTLEKVLGMGSKSGDESRAAKNKAPMDYDVAVVCQLVVDFLNATPRKDPQNLDGHLLTAEALNLSDIAHQRIATAHERYFAEEQDMWDKFDTKLVQSVQLVMEEKGERKVVKRKREPKKQAGRPAKGKAVRCRATLGADRLCCAVCRRVVKPRNGRLRRRQTQSRASLNTGDSRARDPCSRIVRMT